MIWRVKLPRALVWRSLQLPGRLEDEPEILTMHLNAILWALENEGNGAAEVEKKQLIQSLQEAVK